MKREDLKVGDRVKCIKKAERVEVGMLGTITKVTATIFGIEWDDGIAGHSCDGTCENGKGWFVNKKNVSKAEITDWRNEF